jgi:hypothetical protein
MADPRQRRFRLWSWGQQSTAKSMITTPPTVQQVVEKLTELVNLERGVGALYYYLPDESLSAMAQDLCESHRLANVLEGGIDRALQAQMPTLSAWTAVNAIWYSAVWQVGELLATFGFRLIEALRAESELWSVVVDPQAQFFGLAATADETQRYWLVLVTGQRGLAMSDSSATAAR